MDLLQELLQIKEEKGITQRWLADKIQKHIPDFTEDKLSRRFLGKSDITGMELLVIAKYLNINLNELRDKI